MWKQGKQLLSDTNVYKIAGRASLLSWVASEVNKICLREQFKWLWHAGLMIPFLKTNLKMYPFLHSCSNSTNSYLTFIIYSNESFGSTQCRVNFAVVFNQIIKSDQKKCIDRSGCQKSQLWYRCAPHHSGPPKAWQAEACSWKLHHTQGTKKLTVSPKGRCYNWVMNSS